MARTAKEYFAWHYGVAPGQLRAMWANFLWFGYHFFSIPLLAHTMLAPIYRLRGETRGTARLGTLLGDIAVTAIMRVVGFAVRMIVIAIGILFEAMLGILFVPALVLWLLTPMLVLLLAATGFLLLIA